MTVGSTDLFRLNLSSAWGERDDDRPADSRQDTALSSRRGLPKLTNIVRRGRTSGLEGVLFLQDWQATAVRLWRFFCIPDQEVPGDDCDGHLANGLPPIGAMFKPVDGRIHKRNHDVPLVYAHAGNGRKGTAAA